MQFVKPLPFCLIPAWLALSACAVRHHPSATPMASVTPATLETATNRLTLQVPAADPRFRYEGRFDFSDSNAPVIIWQASRISIDCGGDAIVPLFDDVKGQCFFNATVDGSNTVIA